MSKSLSTTSAAWAVAMLFAAGNMHAGDKSANADEQALRKLEREWVDAEARHDAVALRAILDDRFVATFGAGKPLDKNAFIKDVTAGSIDPTESQELSNQTIVVAGDTAVVLETDTVRRMTNRQPSAAVYRFTVTYIRRGGHWVALAEHGVAAKPFENHASSQRSARERLLGTWRLVSDYEIHPDGSRRPELYGPHPIGYLMYDQTGHMCVTEAAPDAPRWADPAKPTDKERVITHKSMEAYCGTFEVRENDGEVIHRPELAEWPHYIGSNQIRHYRFQSDDQLILSLEEIVPGGKKYGYEITWRRVN